MRALIRHHKVDVLVLRRGEQAYVERSGHARILRVPVPDGAIVGRVEAFRRALRRQLEGADYDIVHFSDGWAGKTVLELQPQLKYATVYDAGRSPLTGPLPLDVSVVSELQRTEAECAAAADLVLAPTEPARQFLSGGTDSKRVHLVAPGVDVDLFDWDLPPSEATPMILYIGTLSQGRGIQLLLGAMLDLVRDGTPCELVLAGRAGREFRQKLSATLRDLGLESRVQFSGVLEHARVPELIARAAVCVAPAAPDIKGNRLALYPTKILEYLACQRAVVAPKRSSVSLILRDGQTGLLFEPGRPSDLAATLKRALTDHALRARVARAGYDLVRRAHSASSTRRELLAAYTWLGSISPWKECFATSESESALPDADIRLPGPEDTAAAAWVRGSNNKEVSFDSSDLEISEGTGSGSVEMAIGDSVGEVTRVEISPLLDDSVTNSTSLFPIDQEKADGWVVEDANTRPSSQSGVVGDARPQKSGVLTSMDSSFVAGELNVGDDATAEIELDGGEFSAASQLLGAVVEEEKTRLFSMPENLRPPETPPRRRPPRSSDASKSEKTEIAPFRPVQAGRPPAARASHPSASHPSEHPSEHPREVGRRRSGQVPRTLPPNAKRTGPPPVPGKPAVESVILRDEELTHSTRPFPRVPTPPEGSPTGSK